MAVQILSVSKPVLSIFLFGLNAPLKFQLGKGRIVHVLFCFTFENRELPLFQFIFVICKIHDINTIFPTLCLFVAHREEIIQVF